MGGAVAHDLQRLRVFGGDQSHRRVAVDGRVQVHQPVVQLHGDTVAGEPLGDAARQVQAGNGLIKRLYVAIRKCYADH